MCPGLTPELIAKHLQPSITSSKVHLRQESKNIYSNQRVYISTITPTPQQEDDFNHEKTTHKPKKYFIIITAKKTRHQCF